MTRTLTLPAPAKINLFLEVEGRRRDGYHTLFSVMQALSFGDEITLTASFETKNELSLSSSTSLPEENSLIKAARLFSEHYRRKHGAKPLPSIHMVLEKRIPAEAGLGGGSSDATAVLLGLNQLTELPFSEDELLSMALSLGADMPFFLKGGCRSVRGIGELLGETLPPVPFSLVIAKGSTGSATPASYGALDRLHQDFSHYRPKEEAFAALLSALKEQKKAAIPRALYNIFEEVACPLIPDVARIKERLLTLGASGSLMSGSGSAVFGLFESKDRAEAAARLLRQEGLFAEAAEPI